MIKPKFYGKAQGGKFVPDNRDAFMAHLARFKEGSELELTVSRRYKRRTQGAPGEATNFNGYYWAVVVRIVSDAMGEIDDGVTHGLLQMLFNKKGVTVREVVGGSATCPISVDRMIEVPAGTSGLSGAEFAEYCSRIRTWAAIPGNLSQGGVFIPEPNEVEWEGG